MSISEHGAEALVVGESVRDWNISISADLFLTRVQEVASDDICFKLRMQVEGPIYNYLESQHEELKRRPLVRKVFVVLFYWCLFTNGFSIQLC